MARERRSVRDTGTKATGKKAENHEGDSKFPPSCGGGWWQETKAGDEYLNCMISSPQDKETLREVFDEVLENDNLKLKLLIMPNQYKKSTNAPDMVIFCEAFEPKKKQRGRS